MAPLKAAVAIAALLWPAAVSADPLDRWAAEIAQASARFAIPESWIRRVMRSESNGETFLHGQPIVSRAGAMGLMQLMPGTWRDMRALLGLGPDPHDAHDNILAGTAYLRLMYDRFGYPGLFAAYNAGPARYARYLNGTHPLPAETRAYVASVTAAKPWRAAIISQSEDGLFAVSTPTMRPLLARGRPSQAAPAGLFVALSELPPR